MGENTKIERVGGQESGMTNTAGWFGKVVIAIGAIGVWEAIKALIRKVKSKPTETDEQKPCEPNEEPKPTKNLPKLLETIRGDDI